MTNDATPKDASRETSEEPTDSFDHSETCTEGTLATDPEEEGGDENSEKIEKPRGWAALRASNDEDDAVDEDMASRLDFMG